MKRRTEYNVNPITPDGEIDDVHYYGSDRSAAIAAAHEMLADYPAVTVERVVYRGDDSSFTRDAGDEILAIGCPTVLAIYAGELAEPNEI
jgi:hypothetical protein